MKLGIMQPYFLPYIGYWQLIAAVDKYVIYDDVNYIKGGWINRNRILVDGNVKYFNVHLLKASAYKKINEISVNNDSRIIKKSLRIIDAAYKNAPYYRIVRTIIEDILQCGEDNLAKYLGKSIKIICEYLGITTELIYSSSLNKNCELKGKDKVISICKILGATEYYNAIGGQKLYSYTFFDKNKIKLIFLKTNEIIYQQFGNDFQSNLSIIDVLMFNSRNRICDMLQEFSLIEEKT